MSDFYFKTALGKFDIVQVHKFVKINLIHITVTKSGRSQSHDHKKNISITHV